ncbi:MAG: Rnf-Nqr domain containing protein [Desulfocapsaceae bacterium]|jgi:electron transport complex protein RnfA|nr:Rnf-Nqr domain containing protein [Desulfocapsaceae bacterium]
MQTKKLIFLAVALVTLVFTGLVEAAGLVESTEFGAENEIIVTFSHGVDLGEAADPGRYTVFEAADPDIRLAITNIDVSSDGKQAIISFAEPLNTTQTHVVNTAGIGNVAQASFSVSKSYLGYLFSILISALLINNFVFTKYLGLCVFFGTSKRKQTAKGMGVVFTIVIVVACSMSWVLYNYVMKPFDLNYLQIVIFIGLTSLTVQAVDTVLRKVNPVLFKSFGVFLVLVIANCIIIAVPLLMASNEYNFSETLMLSLGAGGGFLLALYLMSSVSERLELAKIPPSFKGLPIAFIVAGQFAMAFLGFSGLQLF